MLKKSQRTILLLAGLLAVALLLCTPALSGAQTYYPNEDNSDYTAVPPFITTVAPPSVLLVMGKNHKLYFAAYDDHSDLDGDGQIDTDYKPSQIDYYGYFDCAKCYDYNTSNSRFEPVSTTPDKTCPGHWSGDFLNYLTMARIDVMRKVLYGGYRSTDNATAGATDNTVLERSFIPPDSHVWGKEYKDVATDGYDITQYSPLSLPTAGTRHLFCNVTNTSGGPPLLRMLKNSTNRIWDWTAQETYQGFNYSRTGVDNPLNGNPTSITDMTVRVVVCNPSVGLESNCKEYPGTNGILDGTGGDDIFKPTGILQRYGETDAMYFGLLTGSYKHNLKGGVLRHTIGSIKTGTTSSTGVIQANSIYDTLNKFRIAKYSSSYPSSYGYTSSNPNPWGQPNDGDWPDWGNPIAETMYEGMRYLRGYASPTSEFTYTYNSGTPDDSLNSPLSSRLPVATWNDPYNTTSGSPWCSTPIMLVISDVNTSYDSDQLPGSKWGTVSTSLQGQGTAPALNVQNIMDTITAEEGMSTPFNAYIGESGSTVNSSCSPKTVDDLGEIRGQCPEEPTKQGSYYAAAVAYYGHQYDLNPVQGDQKVATYAVALASPLPNLEVQVGTNKVSLVPFGKSAYWSGTIDPSSTAFQPTNQIAGFYVTAPLTPTSGQIRINFEDAEQGSDFDRDAETIFQYQVVDANGVAVADPALGAKLKVTLISTAASGGIQAHLGYIISGTTADGTYIDVMDEDTPYSSYYNYYLDTDRLRNATNCTQYGTSPVTQAYIDNTNYDSSGNVLSAINGNMSQTYNNSSKLVSVRSFTPSGTPPATFLKNPLWYAAKWGGFVDRNGTGLPDTEDTWDADGDGVPDTYFYVQNPLRLEEQLDNAFLSIVQRASAGAAASVISSTRAGEGAVYQAVFYPMYNNKVAWTGEVHALLVDAYGNMREDTNGNHILDLNDDLIVQFDTLNPGQVLLYEDIDGDGRLTAAEKASQPSGYPITEKMEQVHYLWSSSSWLNWISDTDVVTQRSPYASTDPRRYIFTFIDSNGNMVADRTPATAVSSEQITFNASNYATISPYLHFFNPFSKPPSGFNATTAAQTEINFIRGADQAQMRSRRYLYIDPVTHVPSTKTWRMGDVVYSTPTAVAAPAEDYDLLYLDDTYRSFYTKYKNRRTVVYAGANDGMFHAFNAGFPIYDSATKTYGFGLQSQGGSETQFALGAELWAYVPYNLLPHLYWLTRPGYQHVYYCDLKPRVFDARIFAPTLSATDEHPYGWATILVGGMRFGGGRIRTDQNHNGIADGGTDNQMMNSAYFIMDITNPEAPPKLLAEVSFNLLGYTTSYPGVVIVKDKDTASSTTPALNKWYLVLGTGPNRMRLKYTTSSGTFTLLSTVTGQASNAFGTVVAKDTTNQILTLGGVIGSFKQGESVKQTSPTTATLTADLYNSVIPLRDAASSQQAGIYMVDLVQLAQDLPPALRDPSNTALSSASTPYAVIDNNAFVSDIVSADLDLDYKADVVYFGTISGKPGSWGGKLRRIVLSDPDTGVYPATPASWVKDSTLIDVGKPITAAPAIAQDRIKQTWVFFGTGRYFTNTPGSGGLDDASDTTQQTYYGVKEPWTDNATYGTTGMVDINLDTNSDGTPDLNEMTWAAIPGTGSPPTFASLLDVSNVLVFEGGTVKCDYGSGLVDCTNLSDSNGDSKIDLTELGATIDTMSGWFIDFPDTGERNLGQAALLGNVLSFTTFVPDTQTCSDEGTSYLWAVNFETGAAFSTSVIGTGSQSINESGTDHYEVLRRTSLGKGLATSPNVHTGRETGSTAFIQSSTGAIVPIQEENPGATKSGKAWWMEQ
jgi:type IV pilus assembly protein PilY1